MSSLLPSMLSGPGTAALPRSGSSSSAVLTRPSGPGLRSGCVPARNTPSALTGTRGIARGADVVDLAPADDARVSRRVHALDRLARLLAGDQVRRRARQVAQAHDEHAGQAEQPGRENRHRDHDFDEREARSPTPPFVMLSCLCYSTHSRPFHRHARISAVAPNTVMARALLRFAPESTERRCRSGRRRCCVHEACLRS